MALRALAAGVTRKASSVLPQIRQSCVRLTHSPAFSGLASRSLATAERGMSWAAKACAASSITAGRAQSLLPPINSVATASSTRSFFTALAQGASDSVFPRLLPPSHGGGGRPVKCLVFCVTIAGLSGLYYVVFKEKEVFEPFDNDSLLPESVDWSLLPAFPEVVDPCYNEKCGCCWAIGAIKSVEALYSIKTGELINLSVQQIIDCAAFEGCLGNTLDTAYKYMAGAGITTESEYPGPPSDNRSVWYGFFPGYCRMEGKQISCRIKGYRRIHASERAFMFALQSGPIAVCLNVNNIFEEHDGSNMLELEMCPPRAVQPAVRHVALLVGYGTDELGRKYFKIQNTWGPWWGEAGYARLRRCDHPLGVAGITECAAFRPVLGI